MKLTKKFRIHGKSGLLTAFGDCAIIINLLVTGNLELCYDLRILAEYEEVLTRPRFQFERRAVAELIDYFRQNGIQIIPKTLPFTLPDPDDAPFLEVALTSHADFLITGNQKHYPIHLNHNVKICSPRQFVQIFNHNSNSLD